MHSCSLNLLFLLYFYIYIHKAKDLPPGTGEEYSKCGGICCNKTCLGPCWPCKEGLKCVGEIDSDGNGQGLCLKGEILFAIFIYNMKSNIFRLCYKHFDILNDLFLSECNGHGIDWNCPVERPYCINETCVSGKD